MSAPYLFDHPVYLIVVDMALPSTCYPIAAIFFRTNILIFLFDHLINVLDEEVLRYQFLGRFDFNQHDITNLYRYEGKIAKYTSLEKYMYCSQTFLRDAFIKGHSLLKTR